MIFVSFRNSTAVVDNYVSTCDWLEFKSETACMVELFHGRKVLIGSLKSDIILLIRNLR